VNQGGGVERLARLLVGQARRGELAQLVVDQREELAGGVGVALLDEAQDVRDFAHDRPAEGKFDQQYIRGRGE
jgi:hypothetical protein